MKKRYGPYVIGAFLSVPISYALMNEFWMAVGAAVAAIGIAVIVETAGR